MKNIISRLNKIEKIIIAFLALTALITGIQIVRAFYIEYSEIQPIEGGVYTEGAVGKITNLNPLFVHQGSVSHDIIQLIFSGLTKYNPKTQEIVGDIADYKISEDGKKYTFVIKENAKWHDGEKVTADDIMFTYNDIIKNPEFNGTILNYNDYNGIKVTKTDGRTVEFLLEKPDSFFPVKTLVGILPKHLLEKESVEFLDSSPFNFMPVGSGKYRFAGQTNFGDHTEISMEAFEDYYGTPPHIKNILVKVFPEFADLQKKLNELDGIRNVPDEYTDKVLKKNNMALERYQLPQYVAVFINNESAKLKNTKVRLALQLGTDKESLISEINEHKTIDTPLLEIDQSNWVNQYSTKKANGALFDTQWKIPKKESIKTEEIQESSQNAEAIQESPENEPDFINSPNEGNDWATTQDKITITGTVPEKTKSITINDYELKKYVPGDSGWSYVASLEFENLKTGENIYNVYAIDFNENKKLIDSIVITRGNEEFFLKKDKEKLKKENAIASILPIRENSKGEKLTLNLITSNKPETYQKVAEILKKQWIKIGVNLKIEILENGEFQKRLSNREYDLLIFGQNLGYNLDAYPYWHSSQAKEGGYNLSQFKNFVADSLLEKARLDGDEESRKNTLNKIQEIISKEVPAVFLYSPTYYFAISDKIQNASYNNLATTSDRFASIELWYGRVKRQLKDSVTPLTFMVWIAKQF